MPLKTWVLLFASLSLQEHAIRRKTYAKYYEMFHKLRLLFETWKLFLGVFYWLQKSTLSIHYTACLNILTEDVVAHPFMLKVHSTSRVVTV